MITLIFNDLWAALESTLFNNSTVMLIMIALVALIKGIAMGKWTELFGRASLALLLLPIVSFFWNGLSGEGRFDLDTWNALGKSNWSSLMNLTVGTMAGYYMIFFVSIAVIFLVKSLVRR